jgi:hypothetical protein
VSATVVTFLVPVATGIVLLSLLAGCASQLSRPTALPAALRTHRILPSRAVLAVSVAVLCAEGVLGAVGTAALLTGDRPALTAVLVAGAGLFAAYAAYSRYAVATGRAGQPCGCSRSQVPLSGWVAGRALALAVLALSAALLVGAGDATPLPADSAERAVVLLATLACAAPPGNGILYQAIRLASQ